MADIPEPPVYIDYVGDELELFQRAEKWKRYVAGRLQPYISGHVLEIGAMTRAK